MFDSAFQPWRKGLYRRHGRTYRKVGDQFVRSPGHSGSKSKMELFRGLDASDGLVFMMLRLGLLIVPVVWVPHWIIALPGLLDDLPGWVSSGPLRLLAWCAGALLALFAATLHYWLYFRLHPLRPYVVVATVVLALLAFQAEKRLRPSSAPSADATSNRLERPLNPVAGSTRRCPDRAAARTVS